MNEYIKIEPAILEEIRFLQKKTGVSERIVLRAPKNDKPPGLTSRIIRQWLDEIALSARKIHLDFVLKRLRTIWQSGDYYVPIPGDYADKLRKERERTGVGAKALLNRAAAPPKSLSVGVIKSWISGAQKRGRKANLDWVITRWESLPDAAKAEAAKPVLNSKREKEKPKRRNPSRILLNVDDLARLRAFRQNTGISPARLLREAENVPSDLTPGIIKSWLLGVTRTARPSHLEFVRKAMAKAEAAKPAPSPKKEKEKPKCKEPSRILLNTDDVARLRALRQNTGISTARLLREAKHVPPGLTPPIVTNWLSGGTRTAQPSHLEFVRKAWEAYERHDIITLTKGDIARLRDLLEMADLGLHRLLRGSQKTMPKGLSASTIRSWLSGAAKTARRDHFESVIKRLQDAVGTGEGRIELTNKHIAAMEAERKRTGVEVLGLMRRLKGVQGAPKAAIVYQWFSRVIKTAERHQYETVLAAWQQFPDLELPEPAALGVDAFEIVHGKIILTDTIRKELRRFQETTGKGGVALLKDATVRGQAIPDGLQPYMIIQWLSGAAKSVPPDYLSFVINAWRACDKLEISYYNLGKNRSSQLASYQKAGLLPSRPFKGAEDKPADLTPGMISYWLSGKPARVRADHWEWLVERCEALLDADDCRVPITDEMVATLKRLREASGVAQTELMRGASDSPTGLTSTMISAWINGGVATARKDFLNYTIEMWTALADKRT